MFDRAVMYKFILEPDFSLIGTHAQGHAETEEQIDASVGLPNNRNV